jgi:type II secretion system protein G
MAVLTAMMLVGSAPSAAQTLPPNVGAAAESVAADTRRPIWLSQAWPQIAAAREALRRGEVGAMTEQLAGKDFVVKAHDIPDAQGMEPMVESAKQDLVFGLTQYAAGNLRGAYAGAIQVVLNSTAGRDERADAYLLLAITFHRIQVFGLARFHAEAAQPISPDLPLHQRLAGVIDMSAGSRLSLADSCRNQDVNRRGWLLYWRSSDNAPGTRAGEVVWMHKRSGDPDSPVNWNWSGNPALIGALTIDVADDSTANQPHYQLVFRDLDAPPLVVADCRGKIPTTLEELLPLVAPFSASLRRDNDRSVLRAQMEARWYHEAGLAPLAAAWARGRFEEEVEQPLRAARSWKWELVGRYPAGADRPCPYEVRGYVNRETVPLVASGNMPDMLEHFHFAAVHRNDRQFVGSYRLVSRRQEGDERLFMIERVAESQISIIEVDTELPSYEQMRDQVLSWIGGMESLNGDEIVQVDLEKLDAQPLRQAIEARPAESVQVNFDDLVNFAAVLLDNLDLTKRKSADRSGGQAKTEILNLSACLDGYRADVGRFPTTEQGLEAIVLPPVDATWRWRGPYYYRSNLPMDPWGHGYRYQSPGAHRPEGFDLWSLGPDGLDKTEDDIGNW